MWAQMIKVRLRAGADTAELGAVLRAVEQPGSGLVRSSLLRDQKDTDQLYSMVVFESEEKARERESDPRREKGLQKAREMMADLFAGPPEFVDLILEEEWTGLDHGATMRSTYDRINEGDVAGFGELLADDFVEHQGSPDLPPTKAGTLDWFRVLLAAFPDLRMTVEDLVADGDRAVARVRVTGTHQGEFMGLPATGARGEIQIVDIMRFDGTGRVCEHWGVADMLTLMQQLGAIPTGAPA